MKQINEILEQLNAKKKIKDYISEHFSVFIEVEFEGTLEVSVEENEQEAKKSRQIRFTAPTKGVVVKKFNPENKIYSVEVQPLPDQAICVVNDGTVVLSTWDPEKGYLLYIQHSDNYISVYKHYSPLHKQSGDKVKAGDVLGYTGVAKHSSEKPGIFRFELWYNGTPVNPENYVTFE